MLENAQNLSTGDLGATPETLRRITTRLAGLEIPYVVVGDIAFLLHGFRRYTDNVELLVRPSGMAIHSRIDPTEYKSSYPKYIDLTDQHTATRIRFFLTGDRPRGLEAGSYNYPDPTTSGIVVDGIPCLTLPALIDMKLATGIAPQGRIRDLADVQDVIHSLGLPRDFCMKLCPEFRTKFNELWVPPTPEGVDEH